MLLPQDFVVKINSAVVTATQFLQDFLSAISSYYRYKPRS